jgi:N-acetyl-alpha-D-glucosaminyl L-malate synthase BshA
MNVGIVCYASVGGSGIVATELAKSLAERGHAVHVLSTDTPFRLGSYQPGLTFHRVHTPAYPLFREPQYVIALASRMVQVAREQGLDIIHAHYAVPHATAAYLAKQILLRAERGTVPQIITTLHGTDITLVGSDHSYAETVAFSIEMSDGVTAVSDSLRQDTYRVLPVQKPIAVIPNFLDCDIYQRIQAAPLRARYCPPGCEKLIIHVSNFRPVKRAVAASSRRRRAGSRPGTGRSKGARHWWLGRGAGRTGPNHSAALDCGSFSAHVIAGKLRSRRARSDGLRGARRGVAGGRTARGHRAGGDRISA